MKQLPPLAPRASLWVTEIGETDEGDFRVVVTEAMPNGPPEIMDSKFAVVAVPVTPTASSRTFELTWESYVSYLVENESFAMPTSDTLVGRGLHCATSSPLLDYVAAYGIAPQILGPLKHWCLICDDHVVNLVGADDPTIRQLP